MVSTRRVVPLVRPDAKVSHLIVDEDSASVVWVEGGRTVKWSVLEPGGQLGPISDVSVSNVVSFLAYHRSMIVVGDEIGHLTYYDTDGQRLETHDIDGGVQHCVPRGLKLVVLSGMGEVILVQFERETINLSHRFELDDVLHVAVHENRIYTADQTGSIVAFDETNVVWRRPSRGEHGERITGLGLTGSGGFFLTREGHAMVAGDEEAIEFEFWESDRLSIRCDLRMRLLTSSPSSGGALMGFDDGSVHRLDDDGRMEAVMETKHPIFAVVQHGSEVAASSWFYIHGTSNGEAWKAEHQGMPQLLVHHRGRNALVFAGDDQNDYTSPEPIGLIDLNQDVVELDDAELTLWFQASDSPAELSAEALYGDDEGEVLNLLTDEERASFSQPATDVGSASLLAAMGEVEPASENLTPVLDESDLLEALGGVDELTLEEEGELMDALSASVSDRIPPRALAGDDQRHVAEEDGTCVVQLDGRGSYDPQNQIKGWAWHDGRGQELATGPKVNLKLPVGRHRFELRVIDVEGSWTTDSLTITIVDGSTS
ncbi:MAG: hypothetical protein CMB34_05830 [Euryarchaeota archaeon]|nr:hypothetical protein [Euryarchaeota archaeon]